MAQKSPSRVIFAGIPSELKENASFCLRRLEKRQGKPTKVTYDPRTEQMAKTDDPSTISDFDTAMKAYAMVGWEGIDRLPSAAFILSCLQFVSN